jgi:hypothetical protein
LPAVDKNIIPWKAGAISKADAAYAQIVFGPPLAMPVAFLQQRRAQAPDRLSEGGS